MNAATRVDGEQSTDPFEDRCPRCRSAVIDSWLVCAACGQRLAGPAELPAGALLGDGRFEIDAVIGRGGFGITYAVGDHRLDRRVAVKELFPDAAVRHGTVVLTPPQNREAFDEARDRFLREARVLARFAHPGIVRVFEVFEEHNTAYLVMELLEGRSLAEVLRHRDGPFGQPEALQVAARVASALNAVHDAGMLHRDVSPSNLIVTDHGRIVLIDFGLARAFSGDQTMAMTRMVTPGYAPPEQYLGSGRFGPPTDVYGLAATVYRLLTKQVPAPAVERQAGTQIEAPHRLNPSVDKVVSDAVLDGLELDPAHRPQSVAAFLSRLGVDPAKALTAPVPNPGPEVDGATSRPTELDLRLRPVPTPARPPTPAAVAPTAYDAGPAPAYPPAGAPVPWEWPVPTPAPPRPQPGRWKVTVPLLAAVVALTSAAPVLLTALLVFVLLPVMATAGDVAHHRYRQQAGQAATRFQRAGSGAVVPVRFVRNVPVSVGRALPALGILALMIGIYWLVDSLDVNALAGQVVLRATGAGVALLLCLPAGSGTSRFRTGAALDALGTRLRRPGGTRFGQAGWAFLIVCTALTAAGLFLRPEAWPIL